MKAFRLWERESRKGNRYLAGFLGPMGVICFIDEDAEARDGVIAERQVWFAKPDPAYQRPREAATQQPRRPRRAQRRPNPPPDDVGGPPLDDPIDDIRRER
jgi:hypothetical protein